jgi:Periplasmic binding protein
MKSTTRNVGAASVIALLTIGGFNTPVQAAAKKVGDKCTKVGPVAGGFVCTQVGNKRVLKKAAAAPTTQAAKPGVTTAATPAPAGGPAAARGFDGKTFKVGFIGNVATNPSFPSSALFADGGKALKAGFDSYITHVNDAGGVNGKYPIAVNFKEAYYDAAESVAKYGELKDDSVMIGEIYGTPATQALRDKLKVDNIIASPISLDAEWVTGEQYLPIGTTYQGHAINVIDWYLKEGGGTGKTICSLTIAPNPYGVAFQEGYDFAFKKLAFKNGGTHAYTTPDATAALLKKDGCDAVANAISGELHMPALLAAGDKIGYNPTYLSSSPSFASRRVTSANSKLYEQVIVVGDGAQWGDLKIPGMKDFIADVTKSSPELIGAPNPAALWGWTQAHAVVALLETAVKNGDVSPDGMKKALAGTGKVDVGGVYPTWNYTAAGQRVAPTNVFIGKADITTPGALAIIKAWDAPLAKEYKR